MALRPPKKKSTPMIGKQLQDYIDRNPGRMTNRILKLARSRKPTGRLNINDFVNARESGVLAGTGFRKKTQSKGPAGKVMKKKRGGLEKAIKREQRQFTAAGRQSKGPVGTKKVSKLKF